MTDLERQVARLKRRGLPYKFVTINGITEAVEDPNQRTKPFKVELAGTAKTRTKRG